MALVYNSPPSVHATTLVPKEMPQSLKAARVSARLGAASVLAGSLALSLGLAPAPAANRQTPTAAPAAAAAAPAAATATPAASTAPAAATDIPFTHGTAAAGAAKSALCAACHGPNGNSVNPEWPRLAGQNAVYIAEQLRLFRSGVRTNPVMRPLAATLSDQDVDDLAVYYEAQTPAGLEADPSYWKAGEALYVAGDRAHEVPACVACHSPLGRGNPAAGYPALRAQQSVYVAKQLNDYASGARFSSANPTADPDSVMMTTIAKRLSPEQIRDVASYVQGMR